MPREQPAYGFAVGDAGRRERVAHPALDDRPALELLGGTAGQRQAHAPQHWPPPARQQVAVGNYQDENDQLNHREDSQPPG